MSDAITELCTRMDFIHAGRATRRFHTMEMFDYQRVDAHSYGVAMFVTIIVPLVEAERGLRLLMASLVHDLAEHKVGDIPSPAKRELGIRTEFDAYENVLLAEAGLARAEPLNSADARVLAIADCADGVAHCISERAKGNTNVKAAFYNYWEYLNQELNLWHPFLDSPNTTHEEGEPALRHWLTENWKCANGGVW